MADDEKDAALVQLDPATPMPPAATANFFRFTRVSDEYQFLLGTVNLMEIVDVIQGGRPNAPLNAHISHRFNLSDFGMMRLKEAVDEIVAETEQSCSKRAA